MNTTPAPIRVLNAITNTPRNLDEIAAITGLEIAATSAEIGLLETDGLVTSSIDGWVRA